MIKWQGVQKSSIYSKGASVCFHVTREMPSNIWLTSTRIPHEFLQHTHQLHRRVLTEVYGLKVVIMFWNHGLGVNLKPGGQSKTHFSRWQMYRLFQKDGPNSKFELVWNGVHLLETPYVSSQTRPNPAISSPMQDCFADEALQIIGKKYRTKIPFMPYDICIM